MPVKEEEEHYNTIALQLPTVFSTVRGWSETFSA